MDADKKVCNTFYETAKPTNLESNLIKSECLKRTLDGLVTHQSELSSKDEPKSSHDEKADISPEIINKKSNDTSPMTDSNCSNSGCAGGVGNISKMNKSFSIHSFDNSHSHQKFHDHHNQHQHNLHHKHMVNKDHDKDEEKDERAEVNKSMAFTIDFGSASTVDEQRHKKLLERFQSRHRRGVSLSKVEDEMCDSSSSSQLAAKLRSPASAKLPRKSSRDVIELPQKPASAGGVKLREKSKATQLKDASKRHSWSPRSSMVEPTQNQSQKSAKVTPNRQISNPLERPLKLHALTKADVKPMPPTTLNIACLQTPLENKESHLNDDQVSEAGTYTLDGDNYTEEQKEKMNIDKMNSDAHEAELLGRKLEINESDSNIETDLEVIDLDVLPQPQQPQRATPVIKHASKENRKNILEVSFYHQDPPQITQTSSQSSGNNSNSKSKVSYLEKLKSRVKNIGDKKFHKTKSGDVDLGTFTSVTTSGVLSIKPTLDHNPHLKRKNSLTKSQIDSSEYVQGLQRNEKLSITDNDKTLAAAAAAAAGYQESIYPKTTPVKSRKESAGSSNTSISTAATKDDWIQEWARNAREYSHHKRTPITPNMSNSYNFESSLEKSDQFGYFSDDIMSRSDCKPQYEEFGDNLEKYNQKNHLHKKPPTPENHEDRSINNLSDHEPISISSARSRRVLRDFDMNKHEPPRVSSGFNIKPPMSPSRIPSPIGSVSSRQKRYGSNKMLYGSDTDLTNDTELYLQRTAAAISTLQNIQRKNSLRNSSLQNSPMSPLSPSRTIVQSTKTPTVITTIANATPSSAYLPPHSRAQSVNRPTVHKRNSSLDSSRFTPTNVMSTSLQSNQINNYLIDNNKMQQKQQQQHSRHNSYDGMLTQRPTTTNNNNMKYSHFDQTDDEYESMPSRGTTLPERQHLSIKQQHHQNMIKQQQSPIKRSSSFNIKAQEIQSPARITSGTPKMHNKFVKTVSAPAQTIKIQKSASSSCFKQMTNAINDDDDDEDYENEFYINPDDDLHANQFTPSDESEEEQKYSLTMVNEPPISNTRYNKTFLMRCEQSKNKTGVGKQLGVIACPNTPEMPRRELAARSSARDRVSMPRDSSLGRVLDRKPLSAGAVPSSVKSTSNNNNSNAVNTNSAGKVTSKYLDISKYKPERGNHFLKRDESKSYLNREVKKSSSSACLQNFQRDVARASSRSSGGGSSRPSSATATKKKDVKNTKEIELAMWKRRASYDPLKAAAEGKRKAEEAKRIAQHQQMVLSSEGSSSVMRSSKSYHSGPAGEWLDDSEDSEFDDEN
ncbi:unnamed protein product [Chironomus riparius]|uniref:Uncharacterized protein n=1 Tax=Chironomus riparius TaxID=315576 RepID=A0A9N9RT91_9DIPT|nr:unnamed protein product [Chironomus riparius]